MKLTILAENKSAQKTFDYQLEISDRTILLIAVGTVACISLASVLKHRQKYLSKQ